MMKYLQSLLVVLLLNSFSIKAQTQLWGMTQGGGSNNHGSIFKTDINGENQAVVYDFPSFSANPTGSLVQTSSGKLYGMTFNGGYGGGIIFELDPISGIFIQKHAFGNGTTWENGTSPSGSLIQASNGKLYGMTTSGGMGSFIKGVLFEYDPALETFTKKHDFDFQNGNHPLGSLIEASNGKLYGMTESGGQHGSGVLFEYDPSLEIYSKVLDFGGIAVGSNPNGDLLEASNGKLYGMTFQGGSENTGILFEYDPESGTFTKKIDFDGVNKGASPTGNLIQGANGKLYGLTAGGGVNDAGILFEYDLVLETLNKKHDFDGSNNGNLPFGSLLQASNNKLYGLTFYGGLNSLGVLFEYDLTAETFTKKFDFDGTNGGNPYYTHMIEVNLNVSCPEGMISFNGGCFDDCTIDISVSRQGTTLSANLSGASYQWINCDNENSPIAGATGQSFSAISNGNYAVIIIKNVCIDTSACFSVTTVGIDGNNFGSEIKIYPNPTKGNVTIETGDLNDIDISVFNIEGKKVYSVENIKETNYVIPAGKLSKGIYFIKIQSKQQDRVMKLMIQ